MTDRLPIQDILKESILLAQKDSSGKKASYIPELANVCEETTNVSVALCNGKIYQDGTDPEQVFSLQSTAKLIVLIGMLEEYGLNKVRSWVNFEPSGNDFASIARLDQFGPLASNPMLNAGAISLCDHIKGSKKQRLAWVEAWAKKLMQHPLKVNQTVFESELQTGDRNRSLAYLLHSTGVVSGAVEELVEVYFWLCSLEATVAQAVCLPMLLANSGVNARGERVISKETVRVVVSIMATCGLYDESGTHLVKTGLPAKSGVSGLTLAVAPGRAGIAVASPRVNRKGNSMRGEIILEYVSQKMDWHFCG